MAGKVKESSGRPKAVINWDEVDRLLECQCSGTEIAGRLGVNPKTLYDRCVDDQGKPFSEYLMRKQDKGKSKLRERQMKSALSGDHQNMEIFLGKQYLDQSDKKIVDVTAEVKNTVTRVSYRSVNDTDNE